MTEEAPKKRSWVKIGCLGLLGLFGAIIVLAMIGNAMMSPEERARLDAERKTEAAAAEAKEQAEKEAAAKAEVDSAEKLTAMQLWSAFQQNEVATQSALKGRSVLITGTVDSITLDFLDEPVVSLETGNQFQSVQLDFDKGDVAQTSALRKGQKVSALCKKVSEVAGTPMLDDCVLQ